MKIEDFKEDFPDVKVQELTSKEILPRKEVQNIVLQMCNMMEFGLIYFEHRGKSIKVYTSYDLYHFAQKLKPGYQIKINNIDYEVVSEVPFFVSNTLCLRLKAGELEDVYDIADLYKCQNEEG